MHAQYNEIFLSFFESELVTLFNLISAKLQAIYFCQNPKVENPQSQFGGILSTEEPTPRTLLDEVQSPMKG